MDSSARSWASEPSLRQPAGLWDGLRGALGGWGAAKGKKASKDAAPAVALGADCLRVVGPLDKRLARELKAQAKALAESAAPAWSLDLAGVTSWDSEGLAALVYALDDSELAGKQLTLLAPPAPLRQTLERAQLHHLFAIADPDEPPR
jgi:anti-anti-sigma factor